MGWGDTGSVRKPQPLLFCADRLLLGQVFLIRFLLFWDAWAILQNYLLLDGAEHLGVAVKRHQFGAAHQEKACLGMRRRIGSFSRSVAHT
ncbi:hypothetical protein [Hydrogenophaga sp.]|uniref:hypothetical protein n=1 Tax=Hydrogenophaga sp. TaxID=1904254 RepID=UPI0019AA2FD7|nr:hypothetical protein [Hydrogenophaga sp.]MBD3893715.1 hypothetical protein [Hydrogenophaga sp.]